MLCVNEDRIYSFFWQHIPDWKLVDCEYKLVNNYDKLVDYTVLEDQVIAGILSFFIYYKLENIVAWNKLFIMAHFLCN
jgi:hypothetical protein